MPRGAGTNSPCDLSSSIDARAGHGSGGLRFDLPGAAVGEFVQPQRARRRAVVAASGSRLGQPALRAHAAEVGLGGRLFAGDDDPARTAPAGEAVARFREQRADRRFRLRVVALAEARVTHVAAGRTNAQIGAELYISPKTASVHVTSIFRKLGVSGREQAVARARELELI